MKVSVVAVLVAAFTLFSADSHANIIAIGAPVDSSGNAVASGNVGSDGTVKFFIPLSGGHAGTFGVGNIGLSGSGFDGTGGAGSMDMLLSFSPSAGGNALHFYFRDLDLIGVNDPYGFLENVAIYNQDMTTQLAFVDSASDPEVIAADSFNQELLISLASIMPLGDPFIAKLKFAAGPVEGYNTPEKIRAYLVKVPEPSSLLIFGIGLLGLGFLASQRRRTAGRARSLISRELFCKGDTILREGVSESVTPLFARAGPTERANILIFIYCFAKAKQSYKNRCQI